MAWRLAHSLDTLRNQLNTAFPERSKRSDGTIGDAGHKNRCSRHNPNDADHVTALDITHDPNHGCDIHAIARRIAFSPHPELQYMISNGEVASRQSNWRWRTYTGPNPHIIHVHFGVGNGTDCNPEQPYDSRIPWNIGLHQQTEEQDLSPEQDKLLKHIANVLNNDNRFQQLAAAGTFDALDERFSTRGSDVRVGVQDVIYRTIKEHEPTRTALKELVSEVWRSTLDNLPRIAPGESITDTPG